MNSMYTRAVSTRYEVKRVRNELIEKRSMSVRMACVNLPRGMPHARGNISATPVIRHASKGVAGALPDSNQ